MANITITNNDLGSTALEVWGTLDGTLQNVAVSDQNFVEGTLLARDPLTGNLIPYAPAAVADSVADVTVDVPSIAASSAPDTAVVVPGSLIGDFILIEPLGVWPVGLSLPEGRCLVNGTVQVRIANATIAAIDPASQILRFAMRHNANQFPPKYVLTYPLTVTASSSAPVTVMSAGKVNQRRLFVHGSPPTVATVNDLDALLTRPIIPVDIAQLAKTDNPANP